MTLYWSSEKTRERYQCRACGSWFSRHKVKCPHRRRSVWDETPEEEARERRPLDPLREL